MVTNDGGGAVAGAVVTMAHYIGEVVHFPSTVADASGRYQIRFSANVLQRSAGRFVARAQVVADGHELYWLSLVAPTNSNNLVGSFPLYPIRGVAAGESMVAAFPANVGECPGWLAERCGIVRITVPRAGNLTVEVTSTDQAAGRPGLEICCVAGNEIYGNPLTLSVGGRSESSVRIALERGSTRSESFLVKTSLQAN